MAHSKGSPQRKIHSDTSLSQETRKGSNTLPNPTPKELQKEWQRKAQPRRRRDIINIRAEINEIETNRTVEQIDETRSWYFERINKIERPLAPLIKKKGAGTQINNILSERGEITTNTKEIQTIIRTNLTVWKKWLHS